VGVWKTKYKIFVFDLKTLHVNGRMTTEVYPCIIFIGQYVVLNWYVKFVLQHFHSSRKSNALSYYVNLL
jgi:hypothetical protein